MRVALFILSLLILPFAAFAEDGMDPKKLPGGLYKLDETHASVTWKVSHLGLSNYTARFTKMSADLMFNREDFTKSRVKATIDPTSIKTDYPYPDKKDFDKKLVEGKSWFNTQQFPSITFMSTSVEQTSENTGKMTGNLTFLGITKPVTLGVTFNKALGNHPFKNKPAIGFSATGSLKRSDFGMKTYIPSVGDEVQITIETEFIHAG